MVSRRCGIICFFSAVEGLERITDAYIDSENEEAYVAFLKQWIDEMRTKMQKVNFIKMAGASMLGFASGGLFAQVSQNPLLMVMLGALIGITPYLSSRERGLNQRELLDGLEQDMQPEQDKAC